MASQINYKRVTIMKNIALMKLGSMAGMMSALTSKLFGSTGAIHHLKPVPSQKSQRTTEQVTALKEAAAAKRNRKGLNQRWNDMCCRSSNPCHKVGKPSQKFLDYRARTLSNYSRTTAGSVVFMEPVHTSCR